MRTCSAIVPAAGLSKRFGGPNKLLQPWGDGTVVGAVVRILDEAGLAITVVTGRDAELVAKAAHPANPVFNPRFESGLGTSIAIGVTNAPEADSYLIALADMPELSVQVVRNLLAAFEAEPLNAIVAPVYSDESDRIGHPVLFGSAYRESLMALDSERGAKSIISSAKERLVPIAVSGYLPDIDSPH